MVDTTHIDYLLTEMVAKRASDLYLTVRAPANIRVNEAIAPYGMSPLTDADIQRYIEQLLTPDQLDEYRSTLEFNTAINWRDEARFRINVFRQQSYDGIVIRRIAVEIPTIEELHLPSIYSEVAMMKRGLILVAGPTGSGKTTSLAAMLGYRNTHGEGHILTVEDPIEFVHQHGSCIVSQRDVGLDTYSYAIALKNALRQRPDMVVIGEIRDREVMEQAIYFAETSHLCLATIHANNSSQAIERVLNFFPEERHEQILVNLSLNLRAILSQRLVPNVNGSSSLALEVMLNNGYIRQLIEQGKVRELRDMIEKGSSDGMMSFDQSLFKLYQQKLITEEAALAEADSLANLRLMISNAKNQSGNHSFGIRTASMTVGNDSDF
ncbi:MAG: PilT/PilU family type 4a pilus ATPase [Rickettsiales bacterium]